MDNEDKINEIKRLIVQFEGTLELMTQVRTEFDLQQNLIQGSYYQGKIGGVESVISDLKNIINNE